MDFQPRRNQKSGVGSYGISFLKQQNVPGHYFRARDPPPFAVAQH